MRNCRRCQQPGHYKKTCGNPPKQLKLLTPLGSRRVAKQRLNAAILNDENTVRLVTEYHALGVGPKLVAERLLLDVWTVRFIINKLGLRYRRVRRPPKVYNAVVDRNLDQILELFTSGVRIEAIAQQLNIIINDVNRAISKLKEQGRL